MHRTVRLTVRRTLVVVAAAAAASLALVTGPASAAPGDVTSLAGNGNLGSADGNGATAEFASPRGIAIDQNGVIYVADLYYARIRKLTPNGDVTTLAGSSTGSNDGNGANAQFSAPYGTAVDAAGNVYVADSLNHRIRKILPNGDVSTLAGAAKGFRDDQGTAAQFDSPRGIAIDSLGTLYVADSENNRIRKVTPSGSVTTLAGGARGYKDGSGAAAQFDGPIALAVDQNGNVYVADARNQRIRKVTRTGDVTTLAGSTQGFRDADRDTAQFDNPAGIGVDTNGNLYVAEFGGQRIRKVTPTGTVSTYAGSAQGFADGNRIDAKFFNPFGIAVDKSGNVYVGDNGNHRIRRIESSPPPPPTTVPPTTAVPTTSAPTTTPTTVAPVPTTIAPTASPTTAKTQPCRRTVKKRVKVGKKFVTRTVCVA